ncbi:MAG: hypothetical protein HXY50_17375, partial [Ignavibacteriaceae bacterium]|nr:hypothetical protein [Ignavibacteriaceae bacterium]
LVPASNSAFLFCFLSSIPFAQVVEIQGTAEKTPFDQETLLGLVALARQGIEQLLAQQAELLTRL